MSVEFAAGFFHTAILGDVKDAGGFIAGTAWFLML
jgi:hypothetical protein